ncbi:hypothetical protein LXL04_028902 [Taraxacum kok-saghyz]
MNFLQGPEVALQVEDTRNESEEKKLQGKRSMRNLFKPRNQGLNPSHYMHNDLRPEKKIFDKRVKYANEKKKKTLKSRMQNVERTQFPNKNRKRALACMETLNVMNSKTGLRPRYPTPIPMPVKPT